VRDILLSFCVYYMHKA